MTEAHAKLTVHQLDIKCDSDTELNHSGLIFCQFVLFGMSLTNL